MSAWEDARAGFRERIGGEPQLFQAPGRVNLIGEHTDYNEGFVLPAAINRATVVAAARRDGRRLRVRSLALDEAAEIDLDGPASPPSSRWTAYIEGMARAISARGVRVAGADLVIATDIPIGAGLSSSAALEVAVGKALLAVARAELSPLELALAGQEAENVYVGARSGLMDQFAVTHAVPGHALLVDCRALTGTPIPLDLPGIAIVVCDSGVRHQIASSGYNQRRSECDHAVRLLQSEKPAIRSLRDLSPGLLETEGAVLPGILFRRCRHVVSENERTLAAADALRRRDAGALGALMADSHRSLRDDYEVSCRELDLLVDAAQSAGAVGSRMMGGGFGGSTINLVPVALAGSFVDLVTDRYMNGAGRAPSMFTVATSLQLPARS